MELLYLLTGVIFKGYDDITDGNIEISAFHHELLKVLTTTLLTISFLKNPALTFYFCITTLVCFINKSADTDFWKAGAVIPFISIFFHISYFMNLSIFDLTIHILISLIIIIILFLEHRFIPEDMSVKKYYTRIALFICHFSLAYLSIVYGLEYLVGVSLFYAGYFGTNLIYHFSTFLSYFETSASPDDKNSSTSNIELKE